MATLVAPGCHSSFQARVLSHFPHGATGFTYTGIPSALHTAAGRT
jgi:hypothetical protein